MLASSAQCPMYSSSKLSSKKQMLSAIDPASGQPVNGSFMDYERPRSDNLPSFATEIVEARSPTNPFGITAGAGQPRGALRCFCEKSLRRRYRRRLYSVALINQSSFGRVL
jgi:hypothetical protein